jgi:hypothetical protein
LAIEYIFYILQSHDPVVQSINTQKVNGVVMKLFLKVCMMSCMTVFIASAQQTAVDLVIFSKNRPLQLYAFLESCSRYVSGLSSVSVIYYADQDFTDAYTTVQQTFPEAQFLQQKALGVKGDFKQLTRQAVSATEAPYIIFAVDDIVVIDHVDLQRCVQLLEQYQAYGFYLRLGSDITECYSEGRHTGQPPLKIREQDVYSWRFFQGTGDWGYPHTVDMTLFRKKDVKPFVKGLFYHSPNTFEGQWAGYASAIIQRRGLCFTYSKIINLPLNLVQNDFNNRHGADYDAHYLLAQFQAGLKMDITDLHKFPHKAPHAEYQPLFVAR